MDKVTPFDWHRMFIGKQDFLYYGEIAFRVLIIYIFAVVLLTFMGKRGRQEMTPFEYLTIIALGSATGDVLFYPEVPIFYAFLIITMIVFLTKFMAYLQLKLEKFRIFISGTPTKIIEDGIILEDNMKSEGISHEELYSILRERGVKNVHEVKEAYMELSGDISIFKS